MININTIYKITNPTGKVYIGQTSNLQKRLRKYSKGDCKTQKLLYYSILKYGWQAHLLDTLYQGDCSSMCLNRLEMLFIYLYNSFEAGLNLTEGGGGRRGHKASEETRAKISTAKTGVKRSPEHVAHMSRINKGKTLTEDHKAKISAALKGRPGRVGEKQSPERIARRVESTKKTITQFTKEGAWVRDWNSLIEAAQALDIKRSGISDCLRGRRKTAGGYIWKYA